MRVVVAALAAACTIGTLTGHAEPDSAAVILQRVSARVVSYYERAERLLALEDVTIAHLGSNFEDSRSADRYQFERRIERERAADGSVPEVRVSRRLLTINGKPPRSKREPDCIAVDSEDPLVDLLAEHRADFAFTFAGTARLDGRPANLLDFRSIPAVTSTLDVDGDCAHYRFENGRRGRVWIDQETDDVLRYDAGLIGRIDFRSPWNYQLRGGPTWMTLERYDESLRFKKVSFADPEEELLLPASIETTTVFAGGSDRRTRSVQTFSNYRRFLGSSRLVN